MENKYLENCVGIQPERTYTLDGMSILENDIIPKCNIIQETYLAMLHGSLKSILQCCARLNLVELKPALNAKHKSCSLYIDPRTYIFRKYYSKVGKCLMHPSCGKHGYTCFVFDGKQDMNYRIH